MSTRFIKVILAGVLFVTVCTYGQTNPSRLGINISGLNDWCTEFIWVDIMKYMRVEEEGGGFTPAQYDPNGYPLYLNSGQSINLGYGAGTDYAWPAGNYHVFFDGEGTLTARSDNETLVQDIGNGHQVWSIGHNNPWFGLAITATSASNHLRNLRIIMPGFEDTYQTQPIHPSFIQHWGAFEAFRFMDVMEVNGSPIENWTDIKPAGFITQQSSDGHDMSTVNWGTSPELLIDLCNRMHKNAWFCIPHDATDDCIRQFAALVKNNLDPSLKVYVEYSNEFWNWMFAQTDYCASKGIELGIGTGGSMEYAVYRSGQMYKIWEEVFAAQSDHVINVFAWQAVDDYWWMIAMDDFFKDTIYNPAGSQPEFYAIAPYFSDAAIESSWTLDDLFREAVETPPNDLTIPWQEANIGGKQRSCLQRGIELGCYESGQHYVDPVDLCVAANRDMRMNGLFDRYLQSWRDSCGGLMVLYNSCGLPGPSGSWGLLERWNQDTTTAPKYLAAKDFLANSLLRDNDAPSAPTGLSASNITATTVDLQWTVSASSDVIGYKIYNGSYFIKTVVDGNTNSIQMTGLISGAQYTFTLRANDQAYNLSDVSNEAVVTTVSSTSVGSDKIPYSFKLNQNYPNPFNPSTKISFTLGANNHTSLRIHDILGREIVTLVDGKQSAGEHTVEWNGKNSAGQNVGSGVYFYQLRTNDGFMSVKKMLMLK